MQYRLGLNPSPVNAFKLKLEDYLDVKAVLPRIPANFGHQGQVSTWGMLGNDQYGDCVFAGAAHEHILWNAANKRSAVFSDVSVLQAYSDVTGFNPNDPASDQGTDMAAAANYRLKTGIPDSNGTRHKIGAYLQLQTGNVDELVAAAYLFGAVGMGITVTDIAMQQFRSGKPWTFRRHGTVEGGHYVPVVGRQNGLLEAVTWGKVQPFSASFYEKCSNEILAYVSEEYLTAEKSPEGFDRTTLLADLQTVRRLR